MFNRPATFVIYPARGLMGASNVVAVRDGNLDAIRSGGATARERFDLALEVKVGSTWGEQSDIARRQAPAEWLRGAAALGIAA
jgi:hypothetical protein